MAWDIENKCYTTDYSEESEVQRPIKNPYVPPPIKGIPAQLYVTHEMWGSIKQYGLSKKKPKPRRRHYPNHLKAKNNIK